ncbi:tetratricopeptide repeat protein [Aestuariibacter sp. AA17]|uniref:Tetratricopeptide repeat protein n=1 Tax=Fluctibacter corallii TaxID=2984329 RepID=A0ABT3A5J4_9ALTE|nr:CDC27 family protein [Aestuariibacter sp. AA17]MCV2883636.1 tetratricopeptide repeat protein [Aestuariibacter sp. AA17]
MMNLRHISNIVVFASITLGIYSAPVVTGQQWVLAQESGEQQTRRTPALRSKVYEQLSRAQSLADEGKTQEALNALAMVEERASSMNSYELAMMYNFYGFIHYNVENFEDAIASFEKVIAQQPIPASFEQSTLFSLAQLNMMRGNYNKTVEYLERWESLNEGVVPAKTHVLKAQAMYQQKNYQDALGYIEAAIDAQLNSEQGFTVPENWYVLQRAIYYELKMPEKVVEVLETMVRLFDEPKYWIQLGGMYGEIGEEKKQLAVLETANQRGFITSASDMFNLAQLYYYHQAPYKSAKMMEMGMEQGVLERNLRNLKFLAQSWSLAKENDKAVPVMRQAAALSEDGQLDAQLAQILLNMEKYDEAIVAASNAIDKGGLRNAGIPHLILGMAYYNKRRFNDALNELANAENFERSRGVARQWEKFVLAEKQSSERQRVEVASD